MGLRFSTSEERVLVDSNNDFVAARKVHQTKANISED